MHVLFYSNMHISVYFRWNTGRTQASWDEATTARSLTTFFETSPSNLLVAYMRACIPTYLSTYLLTYLSTYIHTEVRTYVRKYIQQQQHLLLRYYYTS